MKNLWLILTLIFSTCMISRAQIEKTSSATTQGTVLLGTTVDLTGCQISILMDVPNNVGLSFGSSKFKADNYDGEAINFTMFNISPKVGFLVVENGLIGADLSYAYYKDDDLDDPVTSLGIGPFFRYYIPFKGASFFGEARASFGQVSYGSNDEDKTNITQLGIGAGVAIFVSDFMSLDLMAGFNNLTSKAKVTEDNARRVDNIFGFSLGFSVFMP